MFEKNTIVSLEVEVSDKKSLCLGNLICDGENNGNKFSLVMSLNGAGFLLNYGNFQAKLSTRTLASSMIDAIEMTTVEK